MSFKMAPILALVAMVFLSAFAGYRQGEPQQHAVTQISSPPSVGKTEGGSEPGAAQIKNTGLKPLVYHPPTSERATLSDSVNHAAEAWWSYGVDALLFLLLLGLLAYQLSARTNQDAQNSPEFEDSLKLWGRYIVTVCDTPREIKRTLNDLRYQAMTRRNNGPSITRGQRIVRVLRQFVTGHLDHVDVAMRVDEAVLPPRKAAELANLSDHEWAHFLDPDKMEIQGSETLKLLMEIKKEHIQRFGHWMNDAKSVPKEASDGSDLAAQAAHHA